MNEDMNEVDSSLEREESTHIQEHNEQDQKSNSNGDEEQHKDETEENKKSLSASLLSLNESSSSSEQDLNTVSLLSNHIRKSSLSTSKDEIIEKYIPENYSNDSDSELSNEPVTSQSLLSFSAALPPDVLSPSYPKSSLNVESSLSLLNSLTAINYKVVTQNPSPTQEPSSKEEPTTGTPIETPSAPHESIFHVDPVSVFPPCLLYF